MYLGFRGDLWLSFCLGLGDRGLENGKGIGGLALTEPVIQKVRTAQQNDKGQREKNDGFVFHHLSSLIEQAQQPAYGAGCHENAHNDQKDSANEVDDFVIALNKTESGL